MTRDGASVKGEAQQYPGQGLQINIDSKGLFIINNAPVMLWDEAFQQTDYYRAYTALEQLALPWVTQEDFSPENTPEQRVQAAQYFQVTLNGQPVSGNLWWSQGNNHIDLNFDFDQPVGLADGDVLRLWMGMPEEN